MYNRCGGDRNGGNQDLRELPVFPAALHPCGEQPLHAPGRGALHPSPAEGPKDGASGLPAVPGEEGEVKRISSLEMIFRPTLGDV